VKHEPFGKFISTVVLVRYQSLTWELCGQGTICNLISEISGNEP
jgi:hypothetical protein